MPKKYTFEVIIHSGNDHFWDEIKGSWCDEVTENVKYCLQESHLFAEKDGDKIRLSKFQEKENIKEYTILIELQEGFDQYGNFNEVGSVDEVLESVRYSLASLNVLQEFRGDTIKLINFSDDR